MNSSPAFLFAVGCLTRVVLGLRTKTLQQPVMPVHGSGCDLESTNISYMSVLRNVESERTHPYYFLFHVRKAGGTTMRRWLEQVCEFEHKDKYFGMVAEGSSLTEKRSNEIFGNESNITVSVIHLREPVARAQSLVNMNLHHLNSTCEKGDFDKSHVDPEACHHQTASDELQRTGGMCNTMPAEASPNIPMWNCWQNMYVKSLVGTDKRNSTVDGTWLEVDQDDLELAKQRLAKFSGVVISEWLGNPAVAEYLSQHVFHLSGTIPFGNSNKRSSEGVVGFSTQEWAMVASDNTYDKQLYEFAKELALQRMHDAGFLVSLDQLEGHK
jgi:hypothetical protein